MLKLMKKVGYVPRLCVWELTLACNLNCRHCGSRAGMARDDELSPAEALQLADDLADLGCRNLTLGGGEPLLREDWPQICERLVSRGVRTNMVTNGRSWSEETVKTAKRVGLESVAFSIDGLEDTHTYVRRLKGHFAHLLDCIASCREGGLTVSAITMVHRKNFEELDELRALLAEHRVERWQLQLGNATGNMSDHPELCLRPEDVLTVVPKIAELRGLAGRPKVFPAHNVGYFGEPEADLRDDGGAIPFWVGCTAGCSVIGIESNGNVKGCLSLPSALNNEDAFVEGNIRDTSLEEIWRRKGSFAYNREFSLDKLAGFCRTCDYAEICRGGCAWTSYANTGSRWENQYCYWRQKCEQAERDGEPIAERRHLDLV